MTNFRKILVTEADKDYLAGLAAHLAAVAGAKPTVNPRVFEVPADAFVDFHGVEEFHGEVTAPLAAQPEAIPQNIDPDFERAKAWLESYRGNFDFYLSLKSQLAQKGRSRRSRSTA
jgi:hypothetical protein